jgi:hypothetical protein
MDPKVKFILQKAVDMEQNEKMTAALDNLFVQLTVIPLQRRFREGRYIARKPCGCCYGRRYSSSDDDE